jgi:hypothetical protein
MPSKRDRSIDQYGRNLSLFIYVVRVTFRIDPR